MPGTSVERADAAAPATNGAPSARTVSEPRSKLRVKVRDLFAYREVLQNLVRKELKVKYKNSALGFVWSMLNPLLYLVIFTVVFQGFLGAALPWFAFYLLSGLLAWNLFSTGLGGATGSIVGNASLVTKVYFPREVLPLAAIGASLVHFLLQLAVIVGAMLVTGYVRFWDAGLALVPVALLVELILLAALGLLMASINVYMRDVQHLLELGLLAWFWMTPIVYASAWVQDRLAPSPLVWGTYLANPMTAIALAFQRGLYAQTTPLLEGTPTRVLVNASLGWYWERLGYVAVVAVALLAVAWIVFHRMEGRLAEEL